MGQDRGNRVHLARRRRRGPGGARTSSTAAGASRSAAARRATSSSSTRRWLRGAAARAGDLRGLRRRRGRQREGEFADKFNSMPKYVVSSTLADPEWNEHDRARRRPRRGGGEAEGASVDGDIVVHGSASSCRRCSSNDLVDELRLMVFPVVLGAGKRLFGEHDDKKSLQLVDSKVVGDGVEILVYRPGATEG